MKINIARRKLIIPNTPTPQNLRNHKISFLDEVAPSVNTGCLLFYPSSKPQETSHLQHSLAKILTRFYPFAGRYIKSDHIIDCSDQGAEFIEAEAVDLELVDVAGKAEHVRDFFPRASYEVDKPTIPILSVQTTRFKCGGAAIGVCITHRLCDGSTLKTFLAAWVNACNESRQGVETIIPTFHEAPSCFPGRNWDNPQPGPSSFEDHGIVVRRICFDKEAISKLRSKLRPRGENGKPQYFSKVLAVSAVIAKALMRMDRAKYGKSRDCLLNQAIDMRGKTVPPLRGHACGNLLLQALSSCIPARDATAEIEIQLLVDLMGDAIAKAKSDCAKILAGGKDGFNDIVLKRLMKELPGVMSGERYVLWFSDCTKMGFFEADFGSGKPVWACMSPQHSPNTTVLTSNAQGDGVEAMVHLHKNDIPLFEHVQQINMSKL